MFSGLLFTLPSLAIGSKQFFDRLRAEIHQRERASLGAGQMRFQIQAQAVENRRHDLRGFDGPLHRVTADFIALADNTPAFHTAAGEINRPAIRPMIASARRIDLNVRPNSARLQTSVESNMPRCDKSSINAL